MRTMTDIAKGIVFLASDDVGFMTGAAPSSTAASPRNNLYSVAMHQPP